MGKIAERIYNRFFAAKTKGHKRAYAAGRRNRQHADWVTRPTSANWEIRQSLQQLRARARDAARNDPYLSRYLSLMRSNVIGQAGIQCQPNAKKIDGSLDIDLNKQVKDAWDLWGRSDTCTLSGKLDWIGVQNLVSTQVECDGEALVQLIAADNEFGCALKVWNVDYLDEMYNDTLPGGNRVIMSVEYDANDKPAAYWLTTPASDIMFTRRRERLRTRVPAGEMLHIFEPLDDEAQGRGVTSFKAVLLTAKKRDSYSDGVVDSARMAANNLGFLEQENPEDTPFTGKENDETGEPESPVIDISPMSMNELPPGYKFKEFDPKQPTQNHSAFLKSLLTEEGAALGVPYFLYADDWEAVNFSSSRGGLDGFRDKCRRKQRFYSTTLCRGVFQFFLRRAVLTRQLALTTQQFAASLNPDWKGRGWPYINPQQDVVSTMIEIAGGMSSYPRALAEQGIDYVDHLNEIKAAEKQAIAILGRPLTPVTSIKVTDTGTAPTEDAGPPAPADTKTTPKRSFSNGDAELLN